MAKKMGKTEYEPTESELEILQILWEHEPATVRLVHEKINEKREVGYTTILKQLQRLFEKEIVTRKLIGKTHHYSTVFQKSAIEQNLFQRFVDKVYQGSAMKLVMHALEQEQTTPEEIEALQNWLAKQKKKKDA